ncbi:Gfo/Idh/MocA family oxidoreductase [Aliifodinibius salicampi]|uniref:Gfo/Idh/MocA family oxidoreductase n=1 Tax=Fodinibius salicampi TaxID=1920655 RepID=A0ABT3PUG5_9BACT|nr:Gfo/Idh/MocA family oxidoreductase [Fodinibius salicampi]MCW9711507.1 Gfo/Idh/MocA family oxidoreductase [Fodinibius salicampi]
MGSRKDFIKKATLGAGGLALGLSAKSYGRVMGANDRINIAIMGCGRRVGAYYEILSSDYNTNLSWLCDVKASQRTKVIEALKKEEIDAEPKQTDDIREVLEDPEVDVIFNATPDHWHAPGTLMAVQAGKHVYVEKPCSHNMEESKMLVAAQQKYDKIIQMGNQQRSAPHTIEIINEIHNGAIGRPYKAVAFYNNQRGKVPNPVQQDPPEDLNWELFQGPAPREAYHHDTWDYNWHWYGWKWGTAETGNNATHEVDVARWALQVDYPEQVDVDAAKQHFQDDGWTMYDTMYATFRYADDKTINWDGKSRNSLQTYGAGRGTIIYGTEGSVFVNRGIYRLFDREGELVREKSAGGNEQGTALGGGGSMSTRHILNFLNTIRGTSDQQNSPIDEGSKSVDLCHLANIAYRTGKSLEVDSSTGRIYDREAMQLWGRDYESGWEPKV